MSNTQGTLKTLFRILPYAKKAIPRLLLGIIAGISAHSVALAIPQILRELIDELAELGTLDNLYFLVALVFGMGLLEAFLVLLRRWLVLAPVTGV